MSEIDISNIKTANIKRLDGSLLLVFREVLRCRNATEAARRLNLSQSAVSHALTRLRDLFDDALFMRRPHGLEPTRRALELAPRIDELLDLTAEMLGLKEAFDPKSTRRLFRLSAPEYIMAVFGAGLIEGLSEFRPEVAFQTLHLPPEESLAALRRGDVDVALGRFDGSPIDEFTVEPAYHDDFCVVARRDHPVVGSTITQAQYEQLPHVWAASYSEVMRSDSTADFSELTTAAVVPQWLTALVFVSTTDALATCPRRLAERQADVLNLKVLDPPWSSPPFTVYVVRRTQGRDPGVDWFVDRVMGAIG